MQRSSRLYEAWSSMRLVAIGLGLGLAGLLAAALGVFMFGSGHLVAGGLSAMILSFALMVIYLVSAR